MIRGISGIRAKLLGYTGLLVVFVSIFLTVYGVFTARSAGIDVYREYAIRVGNALSEAVFNDLYRLDLRGLRLRLSAVRKDQSVSAALVLDADGYVLADGTDDNAQRGRPLPDPFVPRMMVAKGWLIEVGADIFKIGRPIALEGDSPLGWLYLQFSLEGLNKRLKKQLSEQLVITGICVLLGLLGALFFASRFTRPITALTAAAGGIRSGDRTVAIPIVGQDEIRLLSVSLGEMLQWLRDSEGALRELNISLDHKVQERTQELAEALKIVQSSIQYASSIQRSILPTQDWLQTMLPNHFISWYPRDVVGGDVYWCRLWGTGFLLALGDCTGHGVPGAFMTLIANGALGYALRAIPSGELGTLLSAMHRNMQEVLGQKPDADESDDGLELGVCYLVAGRQELLFVGARFSLFYQDPGHPVVEIKGDRQGIGYRNVPANPQFATQCVSLRPHRRFFLVTDGIIDQVGGEKRQGFGKKRFMAVLDEQQETPVQEVGDHLYAALVAYQGNEIRRDDVTMIGFTVENEEQKC